MLTDKEKFSETQNSLKKAKQYSGLDNLKRWIPSIIILPIAALWVLNRGEFGLLDNIDLVIHEAGHFCFSLFGKFIYTLGLLWLGQNFINISVYAADAQARKLPLLGGNKVYHDWHYLLSEIGILEYDCLVGYTFFVIAIMIFLVSILMPLLTHD